MLTVIVDMAILVVTCVSVDIMVVVSMDEITLVTVVGTILTISETEISVDVGPITVLQLVTVLITTQACEAGTTI